MFRHLLGKEIKRVREELQALLPEVAPTPEPAHRPEASWT